MAPLKNIRANTIWNKQSVSRTVTLVRLVLLSLQLDFSPHDEGGYRALQLVTPFPKSQLNCQEIPVSNVKIPLCR
jgi:hypothetical protein